MKPLIAFILLSSIILQNCSSLIVMLDYQLNKNYIAKTLCINKNMPKLHCNGKCHLNKRLANEDEKKDQQKENIGKFNFNILFCESIQASTSQATEPLSFIDGYQINNYASPTFSIFHPPLA